MKRLVLLIGVVILSVNVFAQSKGEIYILTSASASFGKMRSETITTLIGGQTLTSTSEQPLNTNLGFDVGFGWFVAKNFRLELALGAYSEKEPREKQGEVWLNNRNKGFLINPSLSYYVKLTDRIYYAPEIGASFDLGTYSVDETFNRVEELPYRGRFLYLNFLSLQFRASQHFAIGVGVGELQYSYYRYFYKDELYYRSEGISCRFNNLKVDARFYF